MAFGIIPQKNNLFALRVIGSCGKFSAAQLTKIAEIAAEFGNGSITATSRGTCEIEGIAEAKLDKAVAKIKEQGLQFGGTGATVRAVVACKGTECRRGMFDVYALAMELNHIFYGMEVPKKFKIGVFGCRNSLGKAMAQDIGVMPSFTELGKFELYVGGLLGNRPVQGRHLAVALTKEQVIESIALIIKLYIKEGCYPQRLRTVLDNKPYLWMEIENYLIKQAGGA